MNRLTAIVIAVVLVAGAVFARSKINHHNTESAAVLRLTCSTELEAACNDMASRDQRIKVTVEAAGTTAARVASIGGAGAGTGFDGWLTTLPWAQIATASHTAGSTGPALDETSVGYGSRVGFAVKPDRLAALQQLCANVVDWACLQKAATKAQWSAIPGGSATWGPVKIGIAPPANEADGLGSAAAAFFKRTDISSTELDTFETWLNPLADASKTPSNVLDALVVQQGELDLAVVTEASAAGYVQRVADPSKRPTLIYPSPVATAEVYLGATTTADGARLKAVITGAPGRDSLQRTGFRRASPAGEPDAGVLFALRDLWKKVSP